jgi:hypothetical protein
LQNSWDLGKRFFFDFGVAAAVVHRAHARAYLLARLIAVFNLHCSFVRGTGELCESLAARGKPSTLFPRKRLVELAGATHEATMQIENCN